MRIYASTRPLPSLSQSVTLNGPPLPPLSVTLLMNGPQAWKAEKRRGRPDVALRSDQCRIKSVIGRRSSNIESGIRLENFADQLCFLTLERLDFTLKDAQLLAKK